MTIETRLAEIRVRVDAAAEGPWGHYSINPTVTPEHAVYSVPLDADPLARSPEIAGPVAPRDAEFIAHSRTDLPALLAAVEAVLELHKPERRYLPYEGANVSYDTAEEAAVDLDHAMAIDPANMPYFDLCAHCKVIEDSPCDGECTRQAGYLASLWPCPTVQPITAALEARDTTREDPS